MHGQEKQEASFTPGSSRGAEPSLCPGIWGLWSAGHTVTSAVISPAHPNQAGEGRWTRIFCGETRCGYRPVGAVLIAPQVQPRPGRRTLAPAIL